MRISFSHHPTGLNLMADPQVFPVDDGPWTLSIDYSGRLKMDCLRWLLTLRQVGWVRVHFLLNDAVVEGIALSRLISQRQRVLFGGFDLGSELQERVPRLRYLQSGGGGCRSITGYWSQPQDLGGTCCADGSLSINM